MKIAIAGATGLVGRHVVETAQASGHEVIKLARSTGHDLRMPETLDGAITGAQAVIDVTQSASMEQSEAADFFTTAAANLGQAARAAGVERTVLLSIIGVDVITDFGYYCAKLAQEDATLNHAPGVRILRVAQFLEFPEQMLDWCRDGDVVTVPEMPTQPVAVTEIARVLVEMADGTQSAVHLELAGPKPERLDDLIRFAAAARGDEVTVRSEIQSKAMADGACLPGPDAVLAGPTFAAWLANR